MAINLDEILVQLALGTFDPTDYPEIYHITDKEILTLFAFCNNVALRRVAAVNIYTPFRIHYKQYMTDPDLIVRECAWEHTKLRFIRRFYREPEMPPNLTIRRNFIDPYNIPE